MDYPFVPKHLFVAGNQEKIYAKQDNVDRFVTEYQKKFNDLQSRNMLPAGTETFRYCTNKEQDSAVCLERDCNNTSPKLPSISRENVAGIRLPVLKVGEESVTNIKKQFNVTGEKKKYIFLTAASSNHFDESQAAIQRLHQVVFPHLSNYSFIFYDMGLSKPQLKLLKTYGKAEVRQFPFSLFPSQMRYLQCYTWKPLVIMAHIEQAEVVVWLDASVRFTKDIRPLLENVTHTGILVNRNGHLFSQHMAPSVFDYYGLGEKACQFSVFQEVEATFIMFHNEPFVRHLIIEPWVGCALDQQCMCPDSSRKMLACRGGRKHGKCHRYDQALLGYILIKLFRYQIYAVVLKQQFYNINRWPDGKYLSDLQKSQHKA